MSGPCTSSPSRRSRATAANTANFGLCQYPGEVSDPGFGRHKTKLKGWSWHSFCKTHYASDPRCGGLPNFLRCHLGVVALLDEAQRLGILGTVSDEGDFWETRSLERLTKEIGEQSAMLAGFLGALKDAMGQAPAARARWKRPSRRIRTSSTWRRRASGCCRSS